MIVQPSSIGVLIDPLLEDDLSTNVPVEIEGIGSFRAHGEYYGAGRRMLRVQDLSGPILGQWADNFAIEVYNGPEQVFKAHSERGSVLVPMDKLQGSELVFLPNN